MLKNSRSFNMIQSLLTGRGSTHTACRKLTDYEVNAELFLGRRRCAESGESEEKCVLNMHIEQIYMSIPVYMFRVFRIYCSALTNDGKGGKMGIKYIMTKSNVVGLSVTQEQLLLADTGEYRESILKSNIDPAPNQIYIALME